MSTSSRKQVWVKIDTWKKAVALSEQLSAKEHRNITISDTIVRAVDCLASAHNQWAWLLPREPVLLAEYRFGEILTTVVTQFIKTYVPDRQVHSAQIDPERGCLIVWFEDPSEPPWKIFLSPKVITPTPPKPRWTP